MLSIRFWAGASLSLVAVLAHSQDLPILPSQEQIAVTPLPAGFQERNRRQLSIGRNADGQALDGGHISRVPSATPLQTIDIDRRMLKRPAQPGEPSLIVKANATDDHIDLTAGPLTLTIDGQTLDLAWAAESVDPSFGYHHVTYKILNQPQGYARFTIGQHEVVGTIVLPSSQYRLVPNGAGQYFVYRQSRSGAVGRRTMHSKPEHTAATLAERRHAQLEKLSQMQPRRARASDRGHSFDAEGDRLGKLSLEHVSAKQISEVMIAMGDVNYAPADLQVTLTKTHRHRGGMSIEFRQLINGIPVWQANQLDVSQDGSIKKLSTQLFDPGIAKDVVVSSESEVLATAEKAIEQQEFRALEEYELLKPIQLTYQLQTPNIQLVPYYEVAVSDPKSGGVWTVYVDANSGEARVLTPPPDLGWRVCQDLNVTNNQHPQTCDDGGVVVGYYHTYGSSVPSACAYTPRPRDQGGICSIDAGKAVRHGMTVANTIFGALEAVDPACCTELGGADHNLDVIHHSSANTQSNAFASYFHATGNILSPPNSSGLTSVELLWHELGHHVLFSTATQVNFASLYGTGQPFLDAFVESYGDLMGVAMALQAPPPVQPYESVGDPWIHLDGAKAVSMGATPRNLKDPQLTSFYHLTQHQHTPHQAGRVISKYFYEISQTAGIPASRFLQLLLQVSRGIKDVDANGLDLFDLRRALEDATANEPLLSAAVAQKFDGMYNAMPPGNPSNPPVGVPMGVPGAPPYIAAITTGGCPIINGVRTTGWRIDWGHTINAVRYVVLLQQINGPLTDLSYHNASPAYAGTNVPATASVTGCNNANQCGPPAITTISHSSLCNW